jgi:hypothetical protein
MNPQNIENQESRHNNSCQRSPVENPPAPRNKPSARSRGPEPVSASLTPPSRSVPSVPLVPSVPRTENFPPAEKISENEKIETPEQIHFRAGSLLARLTSEQRTQLFKWLLEFTISDVLNFIAAPPPRGFGIETHRNTLRRIKGMIRGLTGSAAFETSAATAEYLAGTIRENHTQFAPLISELLLQKAFDAASDTGRSHELKDLINSAIKLRELDLKVQRLQILQERTPRRPRVQIKTSPPLTTAHPDEQELPAPDNQGINPETSSLSLNHAKIGATELPADSAPSAGQPRSGVVKGAQ